MKNSEWHELNNIVSFEASPSRAGRCAGDSQEGQRWEKVLVPFMTDVFTALPDYRVVGTANTVVNPGIPARQYTMNLDSFPYMVGSRDLFVMEAKTGKIRGTHIDGNAYERLGIQVTRQIHHFLINPPIFHKSYYGSDVRLHSVICMNDAFYRADSQEISKIQDSLDIEVNNPNLNFRYHILSSMDSYVEFIDGLRDGSLLQPSRRIFAPMSTAKTLFNSLFT